jgi:cholesterol transport system auxiliary component
VVARRQRRGGARRLRYGLLVFAAAAGLLGGCSGLPGSREVVPVRTYTLAWQPATQPTDGSGCHSLLLSSPRSGPGFGSANMVYVIKPHRLDYFANHRWTDSPARLLAPLLLRAVESSGLFVSVAAAPAPIRTDLRLDTEVLALQQIFNGAHSRVQLRLRTELYDLSSQTLVASRIFDIEEPASSNDPYGGVQAANRAVARLMTQLQAFLAAQLQQPALTCTGRRAASAKTPR